MKLEVLCSIFLAYVLLIGEINYKFKSKLLNKIGTMLMKLTGIMILIYLVLKYVVELQ